jgi:protein SCO1
MMNRLIAIFAALALSACNSGAPTPPPLAGARMGGAFTLVDQDGKTVRESDFKGRYRLIYFGYTFCPDVCPVDMARLMNGLKRFEEMDAARAAKIQPIFISIDPGRDNAAARKAFASAFHPRLIGLAGTVAETEAMIKAYGGYFALGEKKPDGSYTVDHTNMATLYGPAGEPIVLLPQEKGPEAIAEALDQWVK